MDNPIDLLKSEYKDKIEITFSTSVCDAIDKEYFIALGLYDEWHNVWYTAKHRFNPYRPDHLKLVLEFLEIEIVERYEKAVKINSEL